MRDKYTHSLRLIEHFEGFSPVMYRDAGGIPTIGYGRTTGSMSKTDKDSELRFVYKECIVINGRLQSLVSPRMSDLQMAALISFVYNVGLGSFTRSTLRKKINSNDPAAKDELLRWAKVGSSVLPGLVKRRVAEYSYFGDTIPTFL